MSTKFLIGGGYRQVDVSHDVLEGGKQDFTVSNIFALDEWRLAEAWLVSGGVKWELSSIADPTYPWRITVMWLPTPRNSLRLGASTAYRSPTLLEEYQRTIIAGGAVQLLGNTGLESEKTLIYEAGYRGEILKNVYLDISYALKRYQGLIAQQETVSAAGVEYLYVNDDGGDATAVTFEAGLQARPADWLAISVVYGHVDISVDGPLAAAQYTEDSQPSDFGALTVGTRLPGGVAADAAVRYTASFGGEMGRSTRTGASTSGSRRRSAWRGATSKPASSARTCSTRPTSRP